MRLFLYQLWINLKYRKKFKATEDLLEKIQYDPRCDIVRESLEHAIKWEVIQRDQVLPHVREKYNL